MKSLKNIFILLLLSCFSSCNKKDNSVRIQLSWFPGPENAFLFYGIDNGIFDSLNVNIDWAPSKGSSIVATNLANNNFDFGFMSSDYVVVSKANDFPIHAVLVLYHETPVTIFSLESKNIKTIDDLQGKRLGVLVKSSTYPQVISFLKNKGLNKEDYQEIPVSGTMVEMLNDKVDAMMHYTNYGPPEMIGKHGKKVDEIKLSENGVSMYGTCIVVNTDFEKNNPDLVQRFLTGCLTSLEQAESNHQKALSSLLKASPNSDSSEFDLALKITEKLIYDSLSQSLGIGYMTYEGWNQTIKQVEVLNNETFDIENGELFTSKYLKNVQ